VTPQFVKSTENPSLKIAFKYRLSKTQQAANWQFRYHRNHPVDRLLCVTFFRKFCPFQLQLLINLTHSWERNTSF